MITQTVEYYDEHGEEWAQQPFNEEVVKDVISRYVKALKRHTGLPHPLVLDAGCGDGRMAEILVRNYGCQVDGFDASSTMVKLAKERNVMVNVHHAGFLDLKGSDVFDGVFAMSSLQHLYSHQLETAISKITNSCNRRAVIFMCFPYGESEESFTDNKGRHYLCMNEDSIKDLIDEHVPAKEKAITTYVTPHPKYNGWINAYVKIEKS